MMMGLISVSVFSLAYTRLAAHTSWLPSVLAGFCAWLVCTFVLENINLPLAIGVLMIFASITISFLLMPRPSSHYAPRTPPSWEIPARMVSATALVFLITAIAQFLGPKLTGLLTPFPIYASVLAVFTHRYETAGDAVSLLRGVVVGSITAVIFLLVISSTIAAWGVGFAFLSAIGVSLVTHGAVFQFLKSHS